MKLLDLLAAFHNWLCDKDFIWWPFSFLRPEPAKTIDLKLAGLMTLCFGGLAFLFFVVFMVMNNALTTSGLIMTFFSCFGGFFLWFACITKPLWNHRARSLSQK